MSVPSRGRGEMLSLLMLLITTSLFGTALAAVSRYWSSEYALVRRYLAIFMAMLLVDIAVYTVHTDAACLIPGGGLSEVFILLTVLLFPVALLSGWSSTRRSIGQYLLLLATIEVVLLAVFLSGDLVLFYLAFEAVLIPFVLLIRVWRSGVVRLRAAILFFLYTLARSLFMLAALLMANLFDGWSELTASTGSDVAPLRMGALSSDRVNWTYSGYRRLFLWGCFCRAFLVKTPLYPFHLWLFRAHVVSPIAGSVLLAGIVLKLASYGIVVVLLRKFLDATVSRQGFVMALAVLSLVASSLSVLRQADIKAVIALSSVGHMAVVTLGLVSLSSVAFDGAIILGLAHGFVSPVLFIVVGGVLYDRLHTRTIRYLRGLSLFMPVMAVVFFLASLANIATPPFMNWAREFLVIAGLFDGHAIAGFLASTSVILRASYSIWLFSRVAYGRYSPYLGVVTDMDRLEVTVVALLMSLAALGGICLVSLISMVLYWSVDVAVV